MTIAKRFKEARLFLGLTQDAFAGRVGLPKRSIVGYENSEREPGSAALTAMAATGVDINWLLTGQGSMRRATGPAPPQTSQNSPQNAQNTPFQGVQAANQPNSAVFARRLDAIAQLLAAMPEPQAAAVADELFSRAQSASELAALRQAVADLTTAKQRA